MDPKLKKYLFFIYIFLSTAVFAPAHAVQAIPLGSPLTGLTDAYDPKGTHGGDVITAILSNALTVLTLVAGIVFVIQFVLGGLNWISSSGNPEKVQKAQNKMIYGVIGLIAVVAAYGVAFIVGKVLGFDILDPAKYINENFW